jgi:3-dehydroquinate synthase
MVAPGEPSKSLGEVTRLCDDLTLGGASRQDVVVALGGGVTGDLAGFVASICLRGLSLMQIPSSLLAMVDSSVGGKTGVNMPVGKNLVGAFYQPGMVLIDPRLLETLPQPEYRSGMAEVIKHALIQPSTPLGGTDLLETLSTLDVDPLPRDAVAALLERNVAIKHSVVQADERESGLRMILNFGHTAGHAIEADGYRYRHGEAVALGLIVASRVAAALDRVERDYVTRVETLIERAGLPTRLEGAADAVLGRLSRDKKNVDGALHWILPRADGIVEPVTDVPIDVIRAALTDTGAV